jgi:hypothetical protein
MSENNMSALMAIMAPLSGDEVAVDAEEQQVLNGIPRLLPENADKAQNEEKCQEKAILDFVYKHMMDVSFGEAVYGCEFFCTALRDQILPRMMETVKSRDRHELPAKLATDIGMKFLAPTMTKLKKENELRICLEAAFIMLIMSRSDNATSHVNTTEEMLEKYPEFSNIHDGELKILMSFRNLMVIAMQSIVPRYNKNRLLTLVTRIVEGRSKRYITGSGQTQSTANRVLIYERESGICPVPRPPRPGHLGFYIVEEEDDTEDESDEELVKFKKGGKNQTPAKTVASKTPAKTPSKTPSQTTAKPPAKTASKTGAKKSSVSPPKSPAKPPARTPAKIAKKRGRPRKAISEEEVGTAAPSSTKKRKAGNGATASAAANTNGNSRNQRENYYDDLDYEPSEGSDTDVSDTATPTAKVSKTGAWKVVRKLSGESTTSNGDPYVFHSPFMDLYSGDSINPIHMDCFSSASDFFTAPSDAHSSSSRSGLEDIAEFHEESNEDHFAAILLANSD